VFLTFIRQYRRNSEKITKYFHILFLYVRANEAYVEIGQVNKNFKIDSATTLLPLLGDIFKRA
jgi:hypothetical protein